MTLDNPAIFYTPHADDETLSMGLDIANHVEAGREVIIVLMTKGASKGMLDILNGVVHDNVAGYRHDPVREAYKHGVLTSLTAGQSRINEFIGAAGAYRLLTTGSQKVTVDVQNYDDGALTVDQAKTVMSRYDAMYPRASHKTMTYTDPHRDHKACGEALKSLRDEGALTDARWYVQNENRGVTAAAGVTFWTVSPQSNRSDEAVRHAARVYASWNPVVGSYGFGYRSVSASFDALTTYPQAWAHA